VNKKIEFPDSARPAPCTIWGDEPTLEDIREIRGDLSEEAVAYRDKFAEAIEQSLAARP